jgi:hypothetical protein
MPAHAVRFLSKSSRILRRILRKSSFLQTFLQFDSEMVLHRISYAQGRASDWVSVWRWKCGLPQLFLRKPVPNLRNCRILIKLYGKSWELNLLKHETNLHRLKSITSFTSFMSFTSYHLRNLRHVRFCFQFHKPFARLWSAPQFFCLLIK